VSQNITDKADAAEARTQETRGFMQQVRVAARRKYTPEEKVRIVLEGFRREVAVRAILLTHYHFDHIRDVATIGLSTAYSPEPIEVCAPQVVLEALAEHLINGKLYPNFQQWPPDSPSLRFRTLLPHKFCQVIGYEVLPLPVNHKVPTVGYQVKDRQGKSLFYTGDTFRGLSRCW